MRLFTFTLSIIISVFLFLSCGTESTPTYTLSTSVVGEGTITPSGGTYDEGETVTLTSTPSEHWVFNNWSGDGSGSSNTITITMNSNIDLVGNFQRRDYPLSISIEGNGSVKEEIISSKKTNIYQSETIVELHAFPSDSWVFVKWSGDIESNENPLVIKIDNRMSVKATFEKLRTPFISRAERFSQINETTGYFSKLQSFKRYISLVEAELIHDGLDYMFDNFDSITYDFNNDGFLDLFFFGMSTSIWSGNFGSHKNGKYFFIPDYFNQTPPYEMIEHNSIIEFAAGGIELQDLNNNGSKEILIYTTNVHQVGTGFIGDKSSPPKELGVVILEIDENFNILREREVGTPKALHRGSSGDVNNNGQIDILSFPIGSELPPNTEIFTKFPTMLYNNGNGTFNEQQIFKDFDSIIRPDKDIYYHIEATAVHLFDIDGDGYLDLIFGRQIGDVDQTPDYYWATQNIYILWGDGSGKFSFEDRMALPYDNHLGIHLTPLGYGFTDFNKNGHIDIILQSTSGYNNYILTLFENKGNREFEDVTVEKIDGYYHFEDEHLGDMGEMMPIDKNGNGWYDLVPRDVKVFCCIGTGRNHVSDLWWENVGGRFVRRFEN